MLRQVTSAAILSLSCAACGQGASLADEAPGWSQEAIIGGQPDGADPAIVLLVSYPQDQSSVGLCTASLVAPDVLLTAAHCVAPAAHPGESFGAFLGADANALVAASTLIPALVPVKEVHVHPAYDPAPPFDADIAVAILASPLGTPPLPVRTTPLPADIAGKAARLVGYGQTSYGQPNAAKRTTDTVVAQVDPGDTITVGDASHRGCVGDSGGPALVVLDGVETVVGVDSYTDFVGCADPAHYRRTDTHAAFVTPFLPASGGAGGAGSGGDAGASAGGGGGAAGGAAGGASAGGSSTGGAGADAGPAGSAASSSGDGGCSVSARDASHESVWLVLLAFFAAAGRRHRPQSRGRALRS